MRLRIGLLSVLFLTATVSAYGFDIVIDNFSCSDSASVTGTSFKSSFISCPGSLGGEREDFFVFLSGPSDSVSTINSNPPAGAITGTFGPGITGFEGMIWGATPTMTDTLPNLDFVGDSVLVQIQSDSAGTLVLTLASNSTNYDIYTATFAGKSIYQDVLIPFTNPTVGGTGANLDEVESINLDVTLDTPGGTWTIDGVDAVPTPEPSTLLLLTIGLLLVVIVHFRRRQTGDVS